MCCWFLVLCVLCLILVGGLLLVVRAFGVFVFSCVVVVCLFLGAFGLLFCLVGGGWRWGSFLWFFVCGFFVHFFGVFVWVCLVWWWVFGRGVVWFKLGGVLLLFFGLVWFVCDLGLCLVVGR